MIVKSSDVAEGKGYERDVLLCIPPFGASAYVLFTDMVCDEDTTANGPAMGGLSRMS